MHTLWPHRRAIQTRKPPYINYHHFLLKRFSIQCRKTKTTLTNHKGHKQSSEPIKLRHEYISKAKTAGKRADVSHDWFWICSRTSRKRTPKMSSLGGRLLTRAYTILGQNFISLANSNWRVTIDPVLPTLCFPLNLLAPQILHKVLL